MSGTFLITNLTYQEVMRVSFRTGQLVRRLHGKPRLVVGIARAGVPPTQAFAAGASAEQVQTLLFQRHSSSGLRGCIGKQWGKIAPDSVRLAYKQFMFKPIVKAMDALTPRRVLTDLLKEQLSNYLHDKESGPIVIVDDTIDSGGTINAVIKEIKQWAPNSPVIVFSLATTLGRRVNEIQYTLISGHIAHFVDGDLSNHYEKSESVSALEITDLVSNSKQLIPTRQRLQMYLDLDGTLTSDSFRDAVNCLSGLYWKQCAFFENTALMKMRLLKKTRLISHSRLKKHLDWCIRQLNKQSQAVFFKQLAVRLRSHSRAALYAAAKAPLVEGVIVTAALESYRPAIEMAFDLPVISGSGFDQDGNWVEIGSSEKIRALENFRSGKDVPRAVFLGNTITDSLALGEDLNVVMVPAWDKTGLLTLLGISSWWLNQSEDHERHCKRSSE